MLGKDKDKWSVAVKNSFLKNFTLVFSQDYQELLTNVISLVKQEFKCSHDEMAAVYHAIFINFLVDKILKNPPKRASERTISKEELVATIRDTADGFFYSSYRNYLGEEKYFQMLRRKYFLTLNVEDISRFIVIETDKLHSFQSIKEVVISLINKFCVINNRTVKSGAPYIFLRNISEDILTRLKQELVNDDFKIVDGYEFRGAEFSLESIAQKTTTHNKIRVRVVDGLENLNSILCTNLSSRKVVYQFFLTQPLDITDGNFQAISIEIQSLADVSSIISR